MNKIIKIPKGGISITGFSEFGIKNGEKFTAKIKKGTKWKLRDFRLSFDRGGECECCGGFHEIEFANSRKVFHFDTHLGIPWISPESLLN